MFRAPLLASLAALTLLSSPLAAQSTAAQDAQRQAVFQQMLADPSNRQLMRDYARLSVQARDFEAAAATLERLVDLEPNNTSARVELAVAYFALGSYTVANYHLNAAQASGTLTPEQTTEVARYQDEAVDRDDRSEYRGRLEVGYAYSETAAEQGPFVNGTIDWRIDLGDANVTQWVSELAFSSYAPGETSLNARTSARLRTGPEWRIARDAYGPRLQAYGELGWFQGDPTLTRDYTAWTAGLAYANPIDERFTVYADASAGREIANSTGGLDFAAYEFDLGVTYRPSRDTRFRLSAGWAQRDAIDAPTPVSLTETSLRLSAQHAFDVGWAHVPNNWIAGAFAQLRHFDLSDTTPTQTEQTSYGVSLRAFVFEDIYIETAATYTQEDATSAGATTSRDETVYSVQLGWEF